MIERRITSKVARFSKFACCALAASLLCLQQATAAIVDGNTVTINRVNTGPLAGQTFGGYGSIPGGEFKVVGGSPTQTVITFCIERSEFISLGGTYTASVESGAVLGGLGGQDGSGTIDPISNATAYFYSQFAQGTLSAGGFAYADNNWADALQLFFWRKEGEVDSSWSGLASGTTLTDANALWTAYMANQSTIDNTTNTSVSALNLWSPNGAINYSQLEDPAYRAAHLSDINAYKAQSQLYYNPSQAENPVPEPSTVLIWGSMMGLGLAYNRFRSRAKMHS